jgi:molecular chaperone DnaK
MKMVPYKVVQSGDHVAHVAQGKEYTPPQISAMILQKLKKAAEDYLGEKVTEAVITVPAYFNDAQRQATKDAGKIAGLEVKRIINEPTAAALAYGLDKKKDETIAVYDFGGGTFDISILEVGEGVIEVKSTNGDTHLGGDNIDQRIVDWLIDEFKKDEGLDLRDKGNEMALQRLRDAAERAKIELSTTMQTEINLPFITADASGPKHLVKTLTRQAGRDGEGHHRAPWARVRRRSRMPASTPDKINEVVLVGGQTRMPRIQALVKESLRQGAAQGRESGRSGRDRRGHSGWRAGRRGERPAAARRDSADAVDRDAGRRGDADDPAQHDDSDARRRCSRPRRTARRRSKSTCCRASGRWRRQSHAGQVPPDRHAAGSARRPQIEVTFDIDANGILNVTAKDMATGKDQKITITSSSGLSKEEVERMAKEADAHAAEDKAKRDEVEARNQLDGMVYSIEKMLREHGDKISGQERSDVENALADAKKALEGTDAAAMTKARENLTSASHKLAIGLRRRHSQSFPQACAQVPS